MKHIVAALVALTLTFAVAQDAPPVAKVGLLFDYTGALAEFGPSMENAADLAAEQLNSAAQAVLGGPIIELVVEDGATSPSVGVDRARKMMDTDQVVAIVGALSSGVTTTVAESVTIPGELILMSPASTSPILSVLEDNDFVFRTVASDATQGIVGAQLARGEIFDDYSHETASVIYVNNPYGQGLAESFRAAFEARGGTVLAMASHPDEQQPTYSSLLETVLADNPDFVVAISYPGQASVYMPEARDLYDFTSWQFVDGTKSEELIEVMGAEAMEGLYGTVPGSDPEWGGAEAFFAAYEESYGEAPGLPFIDTSYDAVSVIGLAIAKTIIDGDELTSANVRDNLREVSSPGPEVISVGDFERALQLLQDGESIDFSGAAGAVDFDEVGDVITPIVIFEYTGSEVLDIHVRSADEIPAE